ncbi:MAG: hypothetical protein IKW13_04045, partial [Thermoguttaceae bacterium]|nr:hypothetical protein [Thermoguttaceae bacterium]
PFGSPFFPVLRPILPVVRKITARTPRLSKTAPVCVPRLLAKSVDAGKMKLGSALVVSTRLRLPTSRTTAKIAAVKTAFRARSGRSATPFSPLY